MKQTYVRDLMCRMLLGLEGVGPKDTYKANYTAVGAECTFEFNGQLYEMTVKAVSAEEKAA